MSSFPSRHRARRPSWPRAPRTSRRTSSPRTSPPTSPRTSIPRAPRPSGGHGGARLLLALLTLLALLAGCGSATATHNASAPPVTASAASTHGSTHAGTATATGAPTASAHLASATSASLDCAATVAGTLAAVAGRIYHEAATGGDVAQATHRVRSSGALASAINAGNASAASAALRGTLAGQIVRVQVLRGGRRVFAQAGAGAAIAPVRGSISGTNATFVLSTQAASSYLRVVHQVTGAQVLLATGAGGSLRRLAGTIGGPSPASLPSAGPVTVAGQTYQVATLSGAVYPAGPLRIALLVPSAAISCPAGATAAQTRVETLGHVGELIYQEELHSPDVSATLRHIEHAPAFVSAVAAHDAAATRAAIVGFFEEHIHVVRVRVTTGAGLLVDVGGPFVLAPVHGAVHSGGRVVGQFEMAIQDDAGYLKLAHLFTGAEVLMRAGTRQVMGTLSPGPTSVPDRGPISYGGHTYQAFSFTGEAFPSGPLRISLLLG